MLILVADDEAGIRNLLKETLKKDHEVVLCKDGEEALAELEKTTVDVVITDHMMPKLTGVELIKKGKEISPSTAFLLMTAFGSVEQAVAALRMGADDYLMKPFDTSEIEHRIQRIEELRLWTAEKTLRIEQVGSHPRLIGKSRAIQEALDFIKRVAKVPSPVLLLGPSGSGKEVVAQSIHEEGARTTRPFIAINCASLSEQLMESELFGHERGAFTGANAAKPGKFELAKGGTLFLDEIGELSAGLQAKLLRVLQENEFYRVGGTRRIPSDARIIAATNRDLKDMVKKGTFREDLFFRLNVLSFELRPLSQRKEDIPLLVGHLWDKLSEKFLRKVRLAPDTFKLLCEYSYPGNVRELQNVLERLMVLGHDADMIPAERLPPEFHSGKTPREAIARSGVTQDTVLGKQSFTEMVEAFEQRLIDQAMAQTGQNQVKAAELLQMSRGMLQYKLRKYKNQKPGTGSDSGEREAA